MKKKLYIFSGLAAIVLLIILMSSNSELQRLPDQASIDSRSDRATKMKSPLTREEKLARVIGLRPNELNECVLDILEGFESKDKDLIRQKVLEWLEKDEDLLLRSLTGLDNLDQTFGYGFTMPVDLIADHLYSKYGGEEMMNKIALLHRNSNNTNELTAKALQSWGKGELKGALVFLKDNPNFDNTWAATELAYDQARNGEPAQVAEFFTNLESDRALRAPMLTSVYENWVSADPEAFANYVNTLDDARPASSAISTYALSATRENPQVAMEWADSIVEPGTRESARFSVAAEMSIHAPEQFKEWYAEQTFPNATLRQDFIESVEEYARLANEDPQANYDREKEMNDLFEFARQNDPSRQVE